MGFLMASAWVLEGGISRHLDLGGDSRNHDLDDSRTLTLTTVAGTLTSAAAGILTWLVAAGTMTLTIAGP